MTWTPIVDMCGREWLLDHDACYALIRANVRAVAIRRRTTVVAVDQGFFLPTIHRVETDFHGLRAEIDREAGRWWSDMEQRLAAFPCERSFADLVNLRSETRIKTRDVQEMQRGATRRTAESIQSTVDNLDNGINALTFVRDMSATVLVTGATLLSGGTALAFLGAGSALRGVARYQDNGNVGSAVLEATGSMVVGAIGFGAAGASGAARHVLILVGAQTDAILEGAKSLVEGNSTQIAVQQAGARFGVGVVCSYVPIDRMAMSVSVRMGASASAGASRLAIPAASGLGLAADRRIGAMAPSVSRNAGPRLGPPPETHGLSFAAAAANAALQSDEEFVRANVLHRA